MTGDTMVRLENAIVHRGDFTLGPLNLELPSGYIMGLVGPNGAGKTTTLRMLLGMVRPASGIVRVLGHEVPGPPAMRQDIGVVLDHTTLVEDWRLGHVERALRPFYPRWDAARYSQLLEGFGLRKDAAVKELSRGMAMKLQVAVALSHGARLLLLDEPTSGLDPLARDEFVGILGDFMVDDRHSVLFSTHITTDLERVADLVTFLRDGAIVAAGPTDDVRDAYRLVKGDARELPSGGPVVLHGPRVTPHGVEAMVTADEARLLGPDVIVERPSLDQLVVHLGAKQPDQEHNVVSASHTQESR
jgi:ABC-2 type transport system ATP-binding protein